MKLRIEKGTMLLFALAAMPFVCYGQKEVEASQTFREGNKVIWITTALKMPEVDKHKDGCARIPGYLDGAICYRICGGGLDKPVDDSKTELLSRLSHQGHDTPFVACDKEGSVGCWAGHKERYPDNHRGCVTAMIWRAHKQGQAERDFKVILHLKP